jgi:tetratricopeptide (TPR) repeat protein
MAEEEIPSEENGDNTILREAINALRLGDRARARDLLTRQLKTDQKNPTYWLWLSAVVETKKERLYCLQMVRQLDPKNTAAKRGLILLGALKADDSVPPFPVNRPRLWEEKLSIPQEPQEKKRGWAHPVVRLFRIFGISVIILGILFISRSLWSNIAAQRLIRTPTHRTTVTITFTPTVTPIYRTATPTFLGPTPLWMFLNSTYTPTPIYVLTQHPIVSRSAFEAGLRFLGAQDYANAFVLFQQALTLEPGAPDLYYYVGETYRGQRDFRKARDAYQEAINLDQAFAPAYLGRARANMGISPNAEILKDLNEAINRDSTFAEAYIERGSYNIDRNPSAAKRDLRTALELTPDSALAYLYLANAQLSLGEYEAALESATRANEIDMTLIPVYLSLARAYIGTGQTAEAVSVLQTYTVFRPEETQAYVQLGAAYNAAGDYQSAVTVLDKAINANRRNAEAYFQRGTAYLNLDSPILAEADFKSAVAYDPIDFDSQLGLARAYFMQDKPRDAYIQAEQKALPLAHSDVTKAQVYYWEALFLESIGDSLSMEAAFNNWNKLIGLSEDSMPKEWRITAFLHLNITPTYTPTLSPTLTSGSTPSVTRTPESTP